MVIFQRDPNEQLFNDIQQILKLGTELPNFYEVLFNRTRTLFNNVGMKEQAKELDKKINYLEIKTGYKFYYLMAIYKNMPYIKGRTRHPHNPETEFFQPDIRAMLFEIVEWLQPNINATIPLIRFSLLPKQTI